MSGILTALEKSETLKGCYNLGHDDSMCVLDLANIVCDEAGFTGVEYKTTGGARGWVGDSPFVHLDTTALKQLGWSAQVSIEESIRRTVNYLMTNSELLTKN